MGNLGPYLQTGQVKKVVQMSSNENTTTLNSPKEGQAPAEPARKCSLTTKERKIRGKPFKFQIGYSHPKNVFNGRASLRGNDVNEKRFTSITVSPKVDTRVRSNSQLMWDRQSEKRIDFATVVNCQNGQY